MTVRAPTTQLLVALLGLLTTACPDDGGTADPSTNTTGSTSDAPADTSGASSSADPTAATEGDDSTGEATTAADPTDASESGGGVSVCGDDVAEGVEACDGTDLVGEDCVSLGFDGGRLGCDARCLFDTAACTIACGNGVVDDGEACDGDDLDGEDCASQGFDDGALGCAADCTFDVNACVVAVCGDDAADGPEDCDGADLGVEDCISLGYDGGAVVCDAACEYDVSGCTGTANCCEVQDAVGCGNDGCEGAVCGVDPYCCETQWDGICVGEAYSMCPEVCLPVCGDGVLGPGEVCDGAELDGATCASQGAVSDCCSPHDGLGCDDDACEATICAFDAFCCDTNWDGQCAGEAAENCAALCAGGVLGCAEGCDAFDVSGC